MQRIRTAAGKELTVVKGDDGFSPWRNGVKQGGPVAGTMEVGQGLLREIPPEILRQDSSAISPFGQLETEAGFNLLPGQSVHEKPGHAGRSASGLKSGMMEYDWQSHRLAFDFSHIQHHIHQILVVRIGRDHKAEFLG